MVFVIFPLRVAAYCVMSYNERLSFIINYSYFEVIMRSNRTNGMFDCPNESSANIDIRNKSKSKSITSYRLKKICRTIISCLFEFENQQHAEVSILFLDNEAMRDLNLEYRNIEGTTDVLAFPMRDGRFPNVGPNVLGDIVISIPAAKHQADERSHTLEKEIIILLIHGFLHLLGHTDTEPQQRDVMQKRETHLLKCLEQRGIL